jgi:hypothetical protein
LVAMGASGVLQSYGHIDGSSASCHFHSDALFAHGLTPSRNVTSESPVNIDGRGIVMDLVGGPLFESISSCRLTLSSVAVTSVSTFALSLSQSSIAIQNASFSLAGLRSESFLDVPAGSSLSLLSSTFSNGNYSGAVFRVNGTFSATSSNFSDSLSSILQMASSSAIVDSCVFSRIVPSARPYGAMDLISSSLLLTNSHFHDNAASTFGGALFCFACRSVVIRHCKFVNNSVDKSVVSSAGGSIYISGGRELANVTNSMFVGSRAAIGGPSAACCPHFKGAASMGGPTLFVNCSFLNNTATQHGGSLF